MQTQLKMRVGVAVFATLALIGMLIFTFSASQTVRADGHRASRSFSPASVAPGGEVTVTVTFANFETGPGSLTETLPAGFAYKPMSSSINDDAFVSLSGQRATFTLLAIPPSLTYVVTASSEETSHDFSGRFTDGSGSQGTVDVGGATMVRVPADDTNGGDAPASDAPVSVDLSTVVASAAVRIGIDTSAETAIPAGEDITVTLKDWGLPSSIPTSSVLILGTTASQAAEPYSGEPSEVRIGSGNKVVLSLTPRYGNGEAAGPLFATQDYSIVFKESAGITNPAKAGTAYVIKVDDSDTETATQTSDPIVIKSKVTLAKSAGPRGTQVEATAVGLNAGDATFYLTNRTVTNYRLDKSSSSGGKAVLTIDTTTQNFIPGTRPNAKKTALEGLNTITVVDGSGKDINVRAQFEITPLIELDGETFKRGGKVDITVSDWKYGALTMIEIGSIRVTEIPRGSGVAAWQTVAQVGLDEYEFSFIVPNSARLGEQELKLTGTTRDQQGAYKASYGPADVDVAKGKILVGAFDLGIVPSTAVTGQVIRIEGTGFEDNACIVEIVVGGDVYIAESTSGNLVGEITGPNTQECGGSGDDVGADSNGNLADTFEVPGNLKAGTYRVTVTDYQRRIGIADLTIPEPEIELDPSASQRGSTVTVIGSNYPAEDVITISYRGRTVTASNTDTVGRFRATFAVPVNAPIGEEHEVEAVSADKADGSGTNEPTLKGKALHMVPDEILEVTPGVAAPGTRITISAANLPLYTPVRVLIGNVVVAGSSLGELAESDGSGEWQGMPLVPQLTPGTHTVEMVVGRGTTGISVSTFLEIADIITRSSDEAFGGLIENGTLTRVWYLDRATQAWSFFDPAPEFAEFNTLSEVSTGQIVTIIMNAQDTFQGATLYPGSNPTNIE